MRYALFGLLCFATALPGCCSGGGQPAEITNIKLGKLMKSSNGNLLLRTEVTRLPLVAGRSGDTDRTFGLCFHYKEGPKLGDVSLVTTPPAAVKTTTSGFSRYGAGNSVRLGLGQFAGREGDFCQELYFDAGDPPGRWRFALMRNGATLRTIDIDVYRP
jgi:hypothetical protein